MIHSVLWVKEVHAMYHVRLRRDRGFTLIELLVVIAIIGVLIALLLPAVQMVREAANKTQCANNLKQLGLAMHNYQVANGGFPPGRGHLPVTNTQAHSWTPFILPYIEQEGLHKLYDFTKVFSDPANLPATQTPLKVLICPSVPTVRTDSSNRAVTDYVFIARDFSPNPYIMPTPAFDSTWQGVLGNNGRRRLLDIPDGTSNTLLLVEDAGSPQRWNMGRFVGPNGYASCAWANHASLININGFEPATGVDLGPCGVNCTNFNEVYGFHPAGAQVVYADGSVRLLRANVDVNLLMALVTRAGGEVINNQE